MSNLKTSSKVSKVSKALDLSNVKTSEDLLQLVDGKELTNDQIFALLEDKVKVKVKNSVKGKRESIYNLEAFNKFFKLERTKIDSSERELIRKKRNFFVNSLLLAVQTKNEVNKKVIIKEFNIFYKDIYLNNDYTVNSLAKKNSDSETLIKVQLFLQIIKLNK
mgnify:CR=1 FL=1